MNLDDMKTKYLNKKFLTYYAIIFVLLYIFFSLIRFLGQLPILLIITFFVTYYITDNSSLYDNKMDNNGENNMFNMTSYLSPSYSKYNNENDNNEKNVMDSSNDYSKFNSKNNITYSKDTSEPEIIIGSSNVVSKNSSLNNSNILPKQSSLGYRSFS
jgi:hypothetical protein